MLQLWVVHSLKTGILSVLSVKFHYFITGPLILQLFNIQNDKRWINLQFKQRFVMWTDQSHESRISWVFTSRRPQTAGLWCVPVRPVWCPETPCSAPPSPWKPTLQLPADTDPPSETSTSHVTVRDYNTGVKTCRGSVNCSGSSVVSPQNTQPLSVCSLWLSVETWKELHRFVLTLSWTRQVGTDIRLTESEPVTMSTLQFSSFSWGRETTHTHTHTVLNKTHT